MKASPLNLNKSNTEIHYEPSTKHDVETKLNIIKAMSLLESISEDIRYAERNNISNIYDDEYQRKEVYMYKSKIQEVEKAINALVKNDRKNDRKNNTEEYNKICDEVNNYISIQGKEFLELYKKFIGEDVSQVKKTIAKAKLLTTYLSVKASKSIDNIHMEGVVEEILKFVHRGCGLFGVPLFFTYSSLVKDIKESITLCKNSLPLHNTTFYNNHISPLMMLKLCECYEKRGLISEDLKPLIKKIKDAHPKPHLVLQKIRGSLALPVLNIDKKITE